MIEAYAKVNAEYAAKTSEQWNTAATASIAGGPASVPDLKGKVPEPAASASAQEKKEEEEEYNYDDNDNVTPILSSTGGETSPYAADDE